MTILQAIILGLIQGITEFLPISSSGHLVLGKYILGVEVTSDIIFEVFVHFGTFIAIIAVFYRKVWGLIKSPFVSAAQKSPDENLKLVGILLAATIPAGVIGILFDDAIENAFNSVILVSCALLVTGTILFITRFIGEHSESVGWRKGIIIGIAQAFAIVPGISRSGSTIATGLLQKIHKEEAAEFSFLLALPAIGGATLLKTKELIEDFPGWQSFLPVIIGTVVATISGYFAIIWLLKIIKKGKFNYFAYYCWIVGIIGIVDYFV